MRKMDNGLFLAFGLQSSYDFLHSQAYLMRNPLCDGNKQGNSSQQFDIAEPAKFKSNEVDQ
jgi:hypothetical protein